MSSRGVRKENDTNRRIIRNTIEDDRAFVQSLKVFGNTRGAGGGGGSSRNSGNIPPPGKITDLGTLTDPFVIDFAIHDERNLVGNIDKNTTITFANIPAPSLLLHLRLYIQSVDPTITIGGTNLKTTFPALHPLAVDDFLDIQLKSTDQTNVTVVSVKKNDEDSGGGGPQSPSFVGNIEPENHTETSFDVKWSAPITGDTPINYDVEYSLSPAENPDGSPVTPITTLNTTNTQIPITGLVAAEAYYVWINAKNAVGESGFNGPMQTNTEGTANPGAINFGLTAIAFDKIDINWDQPAGKQFRFDLKRKETAEATFDIQLRDDEVPTAGTTFTHNDTKLEPKTSYDYRLEIRNEFGQLIGTFNATISTLDLPATVAALTVHGVFLEFDIDPPDGIDIVEIEWNVESDFSGRGGTREIARLPGNTDPIVERTQRLNKSTTYYCRTRVIHNQVFGPYVNTSPTNVTTVDVRLPRDLEVNPDATNKAGGIVELKFRFDQDDLDDNVGARCAVSYRPRNSIIEYTFYDTYDLNDPPDDNAHTPPNKRFEFDRPFPLGDWTIRYEVFNETGSAPNTGPSVNPRFANVVNT